MKICTILLLFIFKSKHNAILFAWFKIIPLFYTTKCLYGMANLNKVLVKKNKIKIYDHYDC